MEDRGTLKNGEIEFKSEKNENIPVEDKERLAIIERHRACNRTLRREKEKGRVLKYIAFLTYIRIICVFGNMVNTLSLAKYTYRLKYKSTFHIVIQGQTK